MRDDSRRRLLTLAGTTSLAALAGCLGSGLGRGNKSRDDPDTPDGISRLGAVSKAGPSEFSDSDDVHAGWVHTVAHGETYDLTFDVRVCHGRQDAVEVDLSGGRTGEYALSFETDGGTPTESNCGFGTRVTGSGLLPTDFESLTVDANGETLRTMQRDGTLPSLRPLPDPIDAR